MSRLILAVLLLVGSVATSGAQSVSPDSLFRAGALRAALGAYQARLQSDPNDPEALARLGTLALWENRLAAAESLLSRATALRPADAELRGSLAETFYRQLRFDRAATLLRAGGNRAAADKLASIAAPHLASVPSGGTRVAFAPGAVLPLISARVNGRPANLLIDTGAGETILDTAFAARVEARRFGTDSASYAGGRRATFIHGAVDSITVAEATLSGVPIHIQATRQYAAAAGGRSVDGIIGTGFLAQFRATIDFGRAELVLEPRSSPAPGFSVDLPFWLLGDHFITTEAVAGEVTTLLVFDTGLAMPGGALVPSAGLLAATKTIPQGTAVSGVGGGGAVTVTPFRFDRLRVGPLEQRNVLSLAGAFPAVLEERFTARIGGLLSHGFFAGQRVMLDFVRMRLSVDTSRAVALDRESVAPPRVEAPLPLGEDALAARARQVVEWIRAKDYDRMGTVWSPALASRLPPAAIGPSWEGLVASLGPVQEIQPAVVTSQGGQRQAKVPVRFARLVIGVTLTFDDQGRVAGVTMQPG
jgi:hypothetical protein